jgi:hypothetical protein
MLAPALGGLVQLTDTCDCGNGRITRINMHVIRLTLAREKFLAGNFFAIE